MVFWGHMDEFRGHTEALVIRQNSTKSNIHLKFSVANFLLKSFFKRMGPKSRDLHHTTWKSTIAVSTIHYARRVYYPVPSKQQEAFEILHGTTTTYGINFHPFEPRARSAQQWTRYLHISKYDPNPSDIWKQDRLISSYSWKNIIDIRIFT